MAVLPSAKPRVENRAGKALLRCNAPTPAAYPLPYPHSGAVSGPGRRVTAAWWALPRARVKVGRRMGSAMRSLFVRSQTAELLDESDWYLAGRAGYR